MADTRTFSNYAQSLPIGSSQYLVGANDRRVPRTSEGLPEGGTTGQAMVKLSDTDYDAGWANMPDISVKANIESPTFTGTPAAPTASPGTNTTQLATTAFVGAAVAAIPSGGDVNGPASSVADRIVLFDGVTGKLIKDSTKLLSDLQPSDADLTAIAALTSAANKVLMSTGAGTWALVDFSSLGQGIVAAPNVATVRTLLSLTPGTDIQAYDAATAKTNVAQSWSKGQRAAAATALAISGGTVSWNLADGNYRELSVTGNFTLNLPSDIATYPRQSGYILLTNTGSFTMSVAANISVFNSASLPTIAQGSGAQTLLTWCVNAAGTGLLISLGGWGVAL